MRRLNVKLLAYLVVGTLVFVVGVVFLQAYQVDRNAKTLLAQAQRERADGKDADAAKLYSQYLKHRDDPQAYSELAVIMTDIADSTKNPGANRIDAQKAYNMLEEAVRLHPELDDVRRLLADYTMNGGRLSDAIQHFKLLRATEKDPVIDTKYARCQIAMGEDSDAEKVLYGVVGFNQSTQTFDIKAARGPEHIEAYILLANFLRLKLDNAERAQQVLAQMIAANKNSAQAYLEHGRYLIQTENTADEQANEAVLKRAEADFSKALELAPDDPNVILAVAETARAQKEYGRAQTLLNEGVKKAPKNEGMYRALALLAKAQDKPEVAREELQRGLVELPQSEKLMSALIDLQFEANDLPGVRKSVASLRAFVRPEVADFADSRLLLAEKKWLEAAPKLEKLRPRLARSPEKVVQIDYFLGQCYEFTSQADRATEAYKRALDADSSNVSAALGYARSLKATGKSDDANKIYEAIDKRLVERKHKGVGVAANLLQSEVDRQMKLAKEDRDWTRVDELVLRLRSDTTMTDVQKALLQAEIFLVKGSPEDFKKASALLKATRTAHPNELAVWLTINKLFQREDRGEKKDNNERSLKLLADAVKQLGNVVPLRTARADIISRGAMGKDATPETIKQATEQLKQLEVGLDKLEADQQLALLADLGGAYYRLRDYENVRRCWEFVKEQRPDDPKIRQTLFDLAQEFGDDAGMTSAIDEINKVMGPKSALYNYCMAATIVADVRGKRQDKKALVEARKHLKDAAKERNDWHELPRLEAEVDELDGRQDAAIVNYQRALELGPLNAATGNRLLNLLVRKNRMTDAKEVLRQLGSGANTKLKDIIVVGDKPDEAIASAKANSDADPKSADKLLWLGQLYSTAGRMDDAEETFRKVLDVAPQMPQGYLLLVNLLVGVKKKPEAEEIIRKAEKELPAETSGALLGQLYELVGDHDRAEKVYLGLLKEKSDDSNSLRGVATYYLRANRPDKASEFVQQVLDQKIQPKDADAENMVWARRAMAQILSGKGDYPNLQKAIKLLEGNAVDGQYAAEDTLMLASLLAQRPELVSRNKAIDLLETLEKSRQLKLEEQLVLVQLYDRVDRWDEARERMGDLLTKSEQNPTYLATFAQLLLKHDDVDNAELWVTRLAAIQPDSVVTSQLQAAVLVKNGQPEKAVTLLSRLIKRYTADQLPRLVTVTTVLEELGQYAAAEKILRDFAAEEPRATLALAAFLARRGSTEEALALCGKARKTHPLSTIIQVGLGTLRQRPQEVTKANHDLIQSWIEKALVDDPESSNLQLQVADFRDLEGNYAAVIKIYRALLARNDLTEQRKAVVQNNLAFVLATAEGSLRNPDEALQLTENALRVLGPSGDLLDTRAMAYLAKGQTKEALADLTVAVADNPSPTKFMHLAMAQRQAGDKGAAMKALKDAQDTKLDPATLSQPERKNYDQLVKEFKLK